MLFVPGIRLFECVRNPKQSGLIEWSADELKAQRKIRSSETTWNGNGWKTCDVTERETPAGTDNADGVCCRQVWKIH